MRPAARPYPVDRYLERVDMSWESAGVVSLGAEAEAGAWEAADEAGLRALHEQLRAAAADLAHLARHFAPRRPAPAPAPPAPAPPPLAPLDDEFNQKVRIERLVEAKFHGSKLDNTYTVDARASQQHKTLPVDPIVKRQPKFKNLSVTRPRIIEIDEKLDKNMKNRLNNGRVEKKTAPAAFKEFTFKHEEPSNGPRSRFQIQDMPRINIRSELKEQKVLQLDIFPDNKESTEDSADKANVAVVAVQHESPAPKDNPRITLSTKDLATKTCSTKNAPASANVNVQTSTFKPVRKISKMSTCESSGSLVSSDTQHNSQHNLKTQKKIKSVIRSSPRTVALERRRIKKTNVSEDVERHKHLNLDEWKKKVNAIYGRPSTSQRNKLLKTSSKAKVYHPEKNILNNAEYIPYSQLTLGGARVSDIEREISNIPNKSDLPLSPILDKILSSKENSPRKSNKKESPRIFTTSDENLLKEVIDIEKKVNKINKTMEANFETVDDSLERAVSDNGDLNKSKEDEDSYANDFEEDQPSEEKEDSVLQSGHQSDRPEQSNSKSLSSNENDAGKNQETNLLNKTCNKKFNLSIKNSVDVFEFVHAVDTQETATQSNRTHKISLKETQTSPRNEKPNIQPIHNDLWPIDPQGEVENMFKLEKDFIKKLIMEEYGDILERNINKPSTSKETFEESKNNVTALQKVTQTSPARVKSVMTSPTRTKAQTTSPFFTVRVDHQTSPLVVLTNEEHLTVQLDNDDDGISINLTSPRFSLQLPQTSREVLSNLEIATAPSQPSNKCNKKKKVANISKRKQGKKIKSSSSSSEIESYSELSSVGEVKLLLKKKKNREQMSISESSDTSSLSINSLALPSVGMIPLRSEGELSVSLRQSLRRVTTSNKVSKSEGEASLGRSK